MDIQKDKVRILESKLYFLENLIDEVQTQKLTGKISQRQGDYFYSYVRDVKPGEEKIDKFTKKTRDNLEEIDVNLSLVELKDILEKKYKQRITYIYDENEKKLMEKAYYETREQISKKVSYRDISIQDFMIFLANQCKATKSEIVLLKDAIAKEEERRKKAEQLKAEKEAAQLESKQNGEEYNYGYGSIEKQQQVKLSEEEERYLQKVDRNVSRVINGPRERSFWQKMRGENLFLEDMQYFYGLAMDITYLMIADQEVELAYEEENQNNVRINNADIHVSFDLEKKKNAIFNKYDVSSLEQLLDKYDEIREKFYKVFSKQTEEQKKAISNINFTTVKSNLVNSSTLFNALKNDFGTFPPSKNELAEKINMRILNGKKYKYADPKHSDEPAVIAPKSYDEFLEIKDYYKNLTKNMDEAKIGDLYKRVTRDFENRLSNPEYLTDVTTLTQKLFCEMIFEKRGMKISDNNQYAAELKKISEEILKENVRFNVYGYNQVDQKTQEKREKTVAEEYIKYCAGLENKKEKISFREFAKQKFGLSNVEMPENLEEMLEESIKGARK